MWHLHLSRNIYRNSFKYIHQVENMYKREQPRLQRMVCDDDNGNEVPAVIIQASSGPGGPPPVKKWQNEETLSQECKKLILMLMKKIDALHEECERDVHIHSNLPRLLTSLKSMCAIVDKIECIECRQEPQEQGLLTDNRGLIYIAVRDCDLERFSVK